MSTCAGNHVLVAGATGFIGSAVLREASRSDIRAEGIVRAPHVGLAHARFIRGTARPCVCNPPIIHAVGASRGDIWSANVTVTEQLLAAAERRRLRRIVYISGYGITPTSSDAYFQSKAAAEARVRAGGIPYTIVRCSYILGFGDELTPELAAQARSGSIAIPGSGRYRIQPVLVDDLSKVLLRAALDTSRRNRVLNVLGRPLQFRDLVTIVARASTSKRVRLVSVPPETYLREALLHDNPTFTTGELALLMSDLVGPTTKLCIGVPLRDARTTLAAAISR